MSEKIIPKLNPRMRDLSQKMLSEIAYTKEIKLKQLKKKISTGQYQVSHKGLAKALIP